MFKNSGRKNHALVGEGKEGTVAERFAPAPSNLQSRHGQQGGILALSCSGSPVCPSLPGAWDHLSLSRQLREPAGRGEIEALLWGHAGARALCGLEDPREPLTEEKPLDSLPEAETPQLPIPLPEALKTLLKLHKQRQGSNSKRWRENPWYSEPQWGASHGWGRVDGLQRAGGKS